MNLSKKTIIALVVCSHSSNFGYLCICLEKPQSSSSSQENSASTQDHPVESRGFTLFKFDRNQSKLCSAVL